MTNLDHLDRLEHDPDLVRAVVLQDREKAYQDRQYKIRERVKEILATPGELENIASDYPDPLSKLLVGVTGEDYQDGVLLLRKWLQALATRIATDEIPEVDDDG